VGRKVCSPWWNVIEQGRHQGNDVGHRVGARVIAGVRRDDDELVQ
jgi:hypothetical protein